MLGGLFPPGSGAEEILSQAPEGHKPKVLDIGTGSGAWAIDVAMKYPNAEKGDASAGLKQYGRFDIIHARAVLQGVKDYAALFVEVSEVLNPRGLFISIEGETGLYNQNKVKYGPQKEGDPVCNFIQGIFIAESYKNVM
ncbi:hypothetical protein FRC04_001459 [Tulasnella sp. 424]|nr:hypothetical protein FRC04_001459 [Tulasnella sp. 424]